MIKYLDTRLVRAITGDKHADEIERSLPAVIGTPNGFQDWTMDDQAIYLEADRRGEPFSKVWSEVHEERAKGTKRESLFSLLKVVV